MYDVYMAGYISIIVRLCAAAALKVCVLVDRPMQLRQLPCLCPYMGAFVNAAQLASSMRACTLLVLQLLLVGGVG